MAEPGWGHDARVDGYEGSYTQQGAEGAGGPDGDDPNEYWRVDAEVAPVFLELAPSAQGESVELGQLPELCRQVGRPLRDEHEQFRLMQELDTTNSMLILRHDFVAWLLDELHAEQRARVEAEPRPIPVATPAWEEVIQDVAEADRVLGSKPSVFYYNTLSGESVWELPSLVRCLWDHLETQEAAQQEAQVSRDGVPAFVKPCRGEESKSDDARELVQQLQELFLQCDDDKSGDLDPAEFQDLCVRMGQPVNGRQGLLALMHEVDPFSSPVQPGGVSWEALRHYWVTNAPFQRRTRLGEARYAAWERLERLDRRPAPVRFRHTSSRQERWGHPAMEQRVADRLSRLFPSSKLDWAQKIDLFLDVHWQQQQGASAEHKAPRCWSLETCWRVLAQLDHPMSRRQHVTAVVEQLETRFGGSAASERHGHEAETLDEAVVRAWLVYCTRKVAMGGWEEVVDSEGQTAYYHEVDGVTQWDPPQLQTQMAAMLSKLGGGQRNLPADDQLARVFRQYDADESGEMTLAEFQRFYRALLGRDAAGGAVSDAQIRQVFGVLDASGDGAVTLDEFQLWWKTKLELEVKETQQAETATREQRRRESCRAFLENADALVLVPGDETSVEAFESNLLPRLVALLGEFPLRGLAYRRALNELVADPMEQLVALERFLDWYDRFEAAEREKLERQRAKQRAQAELRAQQEAQAAAREKQRRRRKQARTLNAMKEQAAAITSHEAEQERQEKLAVLFKTFDADGSGLLDEGKLLQLTRALGHEMDAAQASRMMQAMDSSGDGRVNLDEFLAFWKAFERRRPAAASAALLRETRRDAVSEPAKAADAPSAQLTTSDAVASLAVTLELVKDRALRLTLADMRGFLTDWRDDLLDKRVEQQAERDDAQTLKTLRASRVFVPTTKRVYGAKRLDVTWVEPEVVDCVAAIIAAIRLHLDPPLKPDAAQRIQALVRGHLGRKHVLGRVRDRFRKYEDPPTRLFYFVDSLTGRVLLTRPLYPTSASSVAPLERDACSSKAEKYQFDKRLAQLSAKKRFYDHVCLPSSSPSDGSYEHRPMRTLSAFYMYDVASVVQQRLLGSIWPCLRSSPPQLVLVELLARRRRRQLMQRGRDAAANLPLHYAVRHSHFTVRVVRAMVDGYPEALGECDAFGMTPLHIAFREQRSSLELLRLLARRPRKVIHTRHSAGGKARKLEERVATSVWARQTVCGDTPLHVAILHRASVGVLQWALPACAADLEAALPKLLNKRGESAFHSCLTRQRRGEGGAFTSPRSRSAVLLFFKHFDKTALCATATKCGDLPLHLAMDAFEQQKQRSTATSAGWLWLVELLLTHFPAAVLTPKRSNGLLPVHLALKYGFPEELAVKLFLRTAEMLHSPAAEEQTLAAATTLAGTRTTLLHYALVHQPRATRLLLLLLNRAPTLCRTRSVATGDLPIHVAAAAPGLSLEVLLKLCDVYEEGCRTYNAKRHLPLHLSLLHDVGNVDKATILLRHCRELILADSEERRGLRALLMAANAQTPDYRVLTTLLDVAPSRHLATPSRQRKGRSPLVTPLYALSLRHCAPEITDKRVAERCQEKFEGLEDGDAYFLAMAKAKLRQEHYTPTPKWTLAKILELVERNPRDEALIQRALHATNEKLRAMSEVGKQANGSNQDNGLTTIVESVTLDSDLMLVRTIHQILYEFPTTPRLQLLGQAILSKLLPSAYARAAYKAKVDPYCNL